MDGKTAVHDHDVLSKICLKGAHKLARERDFRHKHDDLAACLAYLAGCLDIDLRLAAARHAMQQKAMAFLLPDPGTDCLQGSLLLCGELDFPASGRHTLIAVAQHAPLPELDQSFGLDRMKDSKRNLRRLQFGQTLLRFLLQKPQQLLLSRPAFVSLKHSLIDWLQQHSIFLIDCRVAFLCRIVLADDLILQKLRQKLLQALRILRQCLAERRLARRPFMQQKRIEICIAFDLQQHMFMCLLNRCILHFDAQPALAGHKEPHGFRERAEIKVGHPARCRNHLRRKPCLLIHGGQNILELHPALLLLCGRQDKSLDLAPAKRHKNAPAGFHKGELVRHMIAVGLRYAFYRQIHKYICDSQCFYTNFSRNP